ncbi:hypothetical protein SUGI_0762230 [Cryptomeria japonica]|uniref:uncharacterized protein LOC131071194 n=1 Tax=Cryptomeria japonica TaxID=3369 RepID=UPI002414B208|nr:uncharacterized protein LOC131071194 [Cryptomeria japonica]GLJ37510.1 hypothetical protein SUGI_0762230 [Cryptomeria japonica]
MQRKKACFLVNWSVTGKRGRKQLDGEDPHKKFAEVRKNTISSAEEVAEERDMACFLVMLACSANANGSVEDGMTEESVFQSKPKLMIPKYESDGSFEESDGGKPKIINQKKMKNSNVKHSIRPKTTRTRIRPDEDGESEALWGDSYGGETNGKYKCNKCHKVFDSHQGLGGHRASHRKVKGCFAFTRTYKIIDEKFQDEEEGITEEGTLKISHSSSEIVGIKVKSHECSVCHKVFQSGQALGGHKRCHRIEERMPAESSLISMDTQQGQSVRNHLPDLNQSPPDAKEDFEAVHSITDEVFSSRYVGI